MFFFVTYLHDKGEINQELKEFVDQHILKFENKDFESTQDIIEDLDCLYQYTYR